MADDAEDDTPTKRAAHYDNQRSSLRSDVSFSPPPRSRTQSDLHRLEDFELDLEKIEKAHPERPDSQTLPSPLSDSSPAPNIPYSKYSKRREVSSVGSDRRERSRKTISRSTQSSRLGDPRTIEEDILTPDSWLHLYELNAHSPNLPAPLQTPKTREQSRRINRDHAGSAASRGSRGQQRPRLPSFPLGRGTPISAGGSQLDITALPSITAEGEDVNAADEYRRSKRSPRAQKASRFTTELYIISYLIFFSILGTLARLGLQALTFYPGAPVTFSELWANVAGTFIMGFLAEDRQLFRAEWRNGGDRPSEPIDLPAIDTTEGQRHKVRHGKVKKTIPMYIGLATGFCGSFTSFSSFIRDIFLSLSNDLHSPINHPYPPNTPIPAVSTTVSRNGGYTFMAIFATILITIGLCYSALRVGAHLALLLDPLTPTFPFRFTRRFADPLIVILGWGMWIGAVIMAIFPPHNAWRGQALFACVFAPVGCLARYYISLLLNPLIPTFPMGTFTANIFGTAVLGMTYDLQHVPLASTGIVGGSVIVCQVLQGLMDGFCGALTTVSTWISEIDSLKRRYAYVYGAVSVGVGLGLLVAIMGSVRWTIGWEAIICIT